MRKVMMLLLAGVTAGILGAALSDVNEEAGRRAAFSLPPAPDYDGFLEVQGGNSPEVVFSVTKGPGPYTGARASTLVDVGLSPGYSIGTTAVFMEPAQFDEVVVFHNAVRFSGPVVFLGPVEWGDACP